MGKDRITRYVLRLRPWSPSSFFLAAICLLVAVAVRVLFASLGATLYFATFFPAILFVSLFAGVPAAIAATVATNIIVWWAFIPPQFAFEPLTVNDVSNFGMFWIAAGLMIWVSHLYRKSLTNLLRVETNRKLLLNELNHRLGNTFSVIQAIINGTVKDRELAQRLSQRIEALDRANKLVTSTSIEPVALGTVIRDEVGVYCSPDRLQMQGPVIQLSGETARSISLIIHELTTNAAKYGSLSKIGGAVLVQWSSERDGFCELHWREVGGPATSQPTTSGFGTRLINASLSAIEGVLEPKFGFEGFSCVLKFSVAS